MSPIVDAVVPVFSLIAVGAAMRRWKLLGAAATRELNRFVMSLALPAMLFTVMAGTDWATLAQPRLAAAFALTSLSIYLPVLAWARRRGASMTDASIDALGASYANTGFIGIPLTQLALGPAALPGAGLSVVLTACVLFAIALAGVEFDRHRQRSRIATLRNVAVSLAGNPLIWAPAAGALVSLSGAGLPAALGTAVGLLAGSASPCALIVLGLFLAGPGRDAHVGTAGWVSLSLAKLVAQPLVAWGIAVLLGLPPPQTALVVLMAMLPTGTGPFMLAERYGRRGAMASRVILVTTFLSVFTLSAFLSLLPQRY